MFKFGGKLVKRLVLPFIALAQGVYTKLRHQPLIQYQLGGKLQFLCSVFTCH